MRLIILLGIFSFAATVCVAEDFKTIDGKLYKNVEISRVEPDGLVVMTDAGVEKIPFENLPADAQKKYGYNPAKAAEFRAGLAKAKQEAEQQMQAAAAAKALTDAQNKAKQNADAQEQRDTLLKEQEEAVAAAKVKAMQDSVEKTATKGAGQILQIIPGKGILISQGAPYDLFFVYGVPDGVADGDEWGGTLYPVGTISYTSTLDVQKTVHAFTTSAAEAIKILNLNPLTFSPAPDPGATPYVSPLDAKPR